MAKDLLDKLQLIVPMAATLTNHHGSEHINNAAPMGLLHSVCSLQSCCLGMIEFVLTMHPPSHQEIRERDSVYGRLPLHFAVSRGSGYRARLPLGAACVVHELREPSPALLILDHFPGACQERDFCGQLPLHVAIDAAKVARCRKNLPGATEETDEDEVLSRLLLAFPSSLGQSDGRTHLFPWQQAAVGYGASLTTIFNLLRREPTHFQ